MNKKAKFTILIPNGTGPTNIGDQLILESLVNILRRNIKNSYIVLHSSEVKLYKKKIVDEFDDTIYSWAVFENPTFHTRILRVSLVLINFGIMSINRKFNFGYAKLRKLLNDYYHADLIILAGGGYLRSKKGLTQNLNLLMLALIIAFVQKSKAKKIIAPISFGPFAHRWQEKLFVNLFKDFEIISLRETYSLEAIKKYHLHNIVLSTDLALLMKKEIKTNRINSNSFILGFTIRNWFKDKGQERLEEAYIQAITLFARQNQIIVIQPIVQVDAPKYGDLDLQVTQQICKRLIKSKIKVLKMRKLNSVLDGQKIYGSIDLLLGMRMHSNIIAATQGTPFVAVSYEYKTEGISKDLGMADYCIKVDDVNEKSLYKLLIKAFNNQEKIKTRLRTSIQRIQEKETKRWNEIFQSYTNL